MSNDIRTRRLIVTLPDAVGEEADTLAQLIEDRYRLDTGRDATVDHALDDAPLDSLGVGTENTMSKYQTVASLDGTDDAAEWLAVGHVLDAYEVEFLRGLLLPDWRTTRAGVTVRRSRGGGGEGT